MNDRPSGRPPSLFTKEELAMEQYHTDQQATTLADSEAQDVYDAGVERVRPSSMYRFGKVLANVFNPVAVWQGMSGMFKEKPEEVTSADKMILQERQERAEKSYAELKKAGFPGTNGGSGTRHSVDVPSITCQQDENSHIRRDSGIDVESHRSSAERKRDGMVFDPAVQDALMPPLPPPDIDRLTSPLPEATPGHKSLRLHKPSFASLKKVKSHLHIPSSKRNSISPAPLQSVETDTENSMSEQSFIRKQPSRKDLQKQQKLYKRVSNLESQLEKARRELQLAVENTPPVPPLSYEGTPLPIKETSTVETDKPLPIPKMRTRGTLRPFVPGALASLPSERILHDKAAREKLAKESGRVVEAPETAMIDLDTPSPNEPPLSELQTLTTTHSKPRQTTSNPTTTQDQRNTNPPPPPTADNHTRKRHTLKPKPSIHLTKPTPNALTPPLHPFDPSNLNLPSLLAKRHNPSSPALFGTLGEDVTNLKAAHPDMTPAQLLDFVTKALAADAVRQRREKDAVLELGGAAENGEGGKGHVGAGAAATVAAAAVVGKAGRRGDPVKGSPVRARGKGGSALPLAVLRLGAEGRGGSRVSLLEGVREEGEREREREGGFVWDEDVF